MAILHPLISATRLVFYLPLILMACAKPSNKLVGTWAPVESNGEKRTSRKITFLPDGRIRVFGPAGEEKTKDSMRYELQDNAQFIRFENKSGEAKEMVVVELTDIKLRFHPAEEIEDTLIFERLPDQH